MSEIWCLITDEAAARGIQTIISFVVMLGAVIPLISGAVYFIYSSRRSARQATFEFLERWLSVENQKRRREFRKIIESYRSETPVDTLTLDQRSIISEHLNSLELIAIYIGKRRIMEKETKEFMQDIVLHDWNLALPLVTQLRHETEDTTFYGHLEDLATRWSGND